MREQGEIVFFEISKGFGFIMPDSGDKDVFVHSRNAQGRLEVGRRVEYDMGQHNGRDTAINVRLID